MYCKLTCMVQAGFLFVFHHVLAAIAAAFAGHSSTSIASVAALAQTQSRDRSQASLALRRWFVTEYRWPCKEDHTAAAAADSALDAAELADTKAPAYLA